MLALPPGLSRAAPLLTVALFDVAPYVITAPGKDPSGPYVSLVRELARSAGFEVRLVLLPFARIPGVLADGSADLTIGFGTEALDKVSLNLGTLQLVDSLVVTSLQKPSQSIDQLSAHVIGRARGGCQDLVRLASPQFQLVDVNNFAIGIRMLALGRLDGLCLTREVLTHYARETGIERAQLGPEIVISRRPVSAFVRRNLDPAVVAQLQAALAKRRPP